MEEWRDIQGYEGIYQVSNNGRVRSLGQYLNHKNIGKKLKKGRVLKQILNSRSKRPQVCLCKDGQQSSFTVHRLVSKAFIPNPNEYTVVHHKDHNPNNNSVENLEWISKEEHDKMHARERGDINIGKFNGGNSKKVDIYSTDGKLIMSFPSIAEGIRHLKNNGCICNKSNVTACCKGRQKSAYGYIWKYSEN